MAAAYIQLHLPILALQQPFGIYGISYDVFWHPTIDAPPLGWNDRSCATYRELGRLLKAAGFERHQYSDWTRDGTSALNTWLTMINLVNINPPSKLATTIKGLKMYHMPIWAVYDQTEAVKLGGAISPTLEGPAPAGLVQAALNTGAVLPVPPVHPGPGVALPPQFTGVNDASINPINYLA